MPINEGLSKTTIYSVGQLVTLEWVVTFSNTNVDVWYHLVILRAAVLPVLAGILLVQSQMQVQNEWAGWIHHQSTENMIYCQGVTPGI
jgi:hypothetical protein